MVTMAMLLSADSVLSCFVNAGVDLALGHALGWTESMTIKESPVIRTLGLGVLSAMGLVMSYLLAGLLSLHPCVRMVGKSSEMSATKLTSG